VKFCPSHIKESHAKEGVDEQLFDAMGIDIKRLLTTGSKDKGMLDHSNVVAPIGIEINKKVMVDHDEDDDLMYKILDHSHQIPKCNNITQVSKGD
jgi:hypothetical protein